MADGLDLSIVGSAGCAAGPGGSVSVTAPKPSQPAPFWGYAPAAASSAVETSGACLSVLCPGRIWNQPKR